MSLERVFVPVAFRCLLHGMPSYVEGRKQSKDWPLHDVGERMHTATNVNLYGMKTILTPPFLWRDAPREAGEDASK